MTSAPKPSETAAERALESINAAMRHYGWGQGEIDSITTLWDDKEKSERDRDHWRQIVTDLMDGATCLPECNAEQHAEDCPIMSAASAAKQLRGERDAARKY